MVTTTSNTLTYSSELMKNYLHAGIMDAEDAFEALQDTNGNAVLFSIGTDGVFYATQEVPAVNNTTGGTGTPAGWARTDISTAQLKHDFPGTLPTCKTMATNQNPANGTIGLAMVVTRNGNDTLYLCMGNSASDTSWLTSPTWVPCPFDDPAGTSAPSPFVILKVFISEASDGQYVAVDINNNGLVQRYYITQGSGGPLWNPHALAIDLQADSPYSSCLGRAARNSIDGIYTFGSVGSSPQFMYCPLWNAFGYGPPTPTLLNLPGTTGGFNQPQAMAAFPNGGADGTTDLLVTATDTAAGTGILYYLPANLGQGPTSGTQVLTHPAFINVAKLHADLTNGVLTVWGLNSAHEIIYTTCDYAEVTNPAAWSVPMPIISGVDMVSPYVNKTNDGNTIFASDGDANLYVLTKSPQTGMWQTMQVTLPSPDATAQPVVFSSYTTRLTLTDTNDQPVGNAPLQISAATRAGFYINNLYTVLDTTPVIINTDPFGVVTIIESVNSLHGTRLTVGEPGGPSVPINPMDKPFNKAASLNTADALQNAVITSDDGTTRPLVPSGASQDDLNTAAQANRNLATAYASLSAAPSGLTARRVVVRPASFGGIDEIAVDFGDLFNWLESGVEAFVSIVEDAATGLYHFVAKIAGQVYRAVLDGVEKIVGAIVWIYNQIKTLIIDLILFLEFLFEWKDIIAAHNVMKNILTLFVQNTINNVGTLDTIIASGFGHLQNAINQWADLTGYDQTANQVTSANRPPQDVSSAPANLGTHHFQSNAGGAVTSYSPPSPGSVLTDLENLITEEGDAISELASQIQTQIVDQFGALSITQIIQKLAAIVADFLLNTAQNVLTTVVEVLAQLTQGVMDLLNTTIDIPVLSWLYKEISGNDLTFLDLFCLIGAIPVTIVYKLAKSEAPFPDGAPLTTQLINASSFAELQAVFHEGRSSTVRDSGQMMTLQDAPPVTGDALGKANFSFGIFAGVGAVAMGILAVIRSGDSGNKKLAAMNGVANLLYIAPDYSPMLQHDSRWFAALNDAITGISALKGLTLDVYLSGKKVSSGVECALNTVWNVPVIANIIYSKDNPNAPDADQYVIPDSVGNFAFNVGGMLAPFSEAKPVIAAQCVLMAVYAGSMIYVGAKQI
ncbi:MAG: hypothetical protein KGZ83_12630 [Sulfuricella sp.]|nr:hypothetical protein [Sulfuricella sp.]